MRAAFLLVPLLLAACQNEPKFEDRYEKAAQEVETRAKAMDADIAEAEEVTAETNSNPSASGEGR